MDYTSRERKITLRKINFARNFDIRKSREKGVVRRVIKKNNLWKNERYVINLKLK